MVVSIVVRTIIHFPMAHRRIGTASTPVPVPWIAKESGVPGGRVQHLVDQEELHCGHLPWCIQPQMVGKRVSRKTMTQSRVPATPTPAPLIAKEGGVSGVRVQHLAAQMELQCGHMP